MKLDFNPLSEGPFYPPVVTEVGQAKAGHLSVGPAQLLNQLAVYLGVNPEPYPEPVRIAEYRQALEYFLTHDGQEPFYAASFKQDPIGVAKTVLKQRDDLRWAAFDFVPTEGMPERLKTLATIEQTKPVSHGLPDRWMAVKEAIKACSSLPIDKINCFTPAAITPPFFQGLLGLLDEKGVEVFYGNGLKAAAQADTDLGKFQDSLEKQANGYKPEPIDFKGDGSLMLLKGETESELAYFTASIFKQNPEFRPALLEEGGNAGQLHSAMKAEGLPGFGDHFNQVMAPVTQLFLLVPQLMWWPQDPYRLLEFLTLPDNPLPKGLCRKLADVVSEKPGRKSGDWQKAVEQYLEKVEDAKDQQKIRDKINFWLEHTLFTEEEGLLVDILVEKMNALQRWAFTKGQNVANPGAYQVLSNLITGFQRILQKLSSDEKLDPVTLEKWLTESYYDHWQDWQPAEKGTLPFVSATANVLEPVDDLLWWNFNQSESNSRYRDWWYPEEADYLKAKDVTLFDRQWQAKVEDWQMQVPVLQAKNCLVLTMPEKVQGEFVEPHPLLADLEAMANALKPVAIDAMGKTKEPFHFRSPAFVSYSIKHLPAAVPYWYINHTQLVKPKDQVSYSSLSTLFYYPYQWILRYVAHIKPGKIPETADLKQLKGSLAHRLAELAFLREDQTANEIPGLAEAYPDEGTINQWVENHLDTLLEQEGSLFLMKGYHKEKTAFKEQLKLALKGLVKALKSGNWQVENMEKEIYGSFVGHKAYAVVDALLKKPNEERGILDLKWANPKYKCQALENEEDLQLALYAQLASENATPLPSGYYMLNKAYLLSRDANAFPKTMFPKSMESREVSAIHNRIWERMVNTYHFRMREIRDGKLEVGEGLPANQLASAEQMDGDSLLAFPTGDKKSKKEAPFNEFKNLIKIG